jgi:hypothetical protein
VDRAAEGRAAGSEAGSRSGCRPESEAMRTIRVLHDNEEFHLVDEESHDEGRTVTVLVPVDRAPPLTDECQPVVPTNRGPHVALARWKDGDIEPLMKISDKRLGILEKVLDKYLTDLLRGDGEKSAAFFYNAAGQDVEFAVSHSHPHGLVIQIYSQKVLAEGSALRNSRAERRLETRKTNNICELLTRAANEGYAGAVLDDSDPVYFCVDEDDRIRFLKLSQNEEEEIEEYLLRDNGEWQHRSDSLDLELYVNQDACDRNMVRFLGEIPFLRDIPRGAGPDDDEGEDIFFTVEESGDPGRLMRFDMEEASPSMPDTKIATLFAGRRPALDFMAGSRQDFDIVAVTDLKEFVRNASREDLVVVLEPGSHRAMTAFLWASDDDVILDSFSGFWKMSDENTFVRLADG